MMEAYILTAAILSAIISTGAVWIIVARRLTTSQSALSNIQLQFEQLDKSYKTLQESANARNLEMQALRIDLSDQKSHLAAKEQAITGLNSRLDEANVNSARQVHEQQSLNNKITALDQFSTLSHHEFY